MISMGSAQQIELLGMSETVSRVLVLLLLMKS
jgi:hypothetical protein